MSDDGKSWLASRWGRMSTGLKMFFILSLGLLPLGVIAVVATVESAKDNREKGEMEARALLALSAQRLNSVISRSSITIRAASDALAESVDSVSACRRALARLQALPGQYALFGEGNALRCATPGFAPTPLPNPRRERSRIWIVGDGQVLRLALFDRDGEAEGISHFRREELAAIVDPPRSRGDFALDLAQGDRVMPLRRQQSGGALSRVVALGQPLAGGLIELRIRKTDRPVTLTELLMILLPVMMWLWAAAVGWLIVQRLLLRPLSRIQNVISAYQPGDRALDLPDVKSPAHEIGALGQAFDRVTRTVARHEADLEAAVDRQTKLVREVHHRVKNNLQVVASLLNLHSRGSPNEEVAAAYASIQRRVDALAVVHRNHYAELEENRGVALKPLISELAANLRATAPPSASAMQIRVDIEPSYATQDAAVSVAFLVTEIVECGMLSGASLVSIVLENAEPGTARLSIEVDSLAGETDDKLVDRFERIVTGLARQLRSALERDPKRGRYSVKVAVVEKGKAQPAVSPRA